MNTERDSRDPNPLHVNDIDPDILVRIDCVVRDVKGNHIRLAHGVMLGDLQGQMMSPSVFESIVNRKIDTAFDSVREAAKRTATQGKEHALPQ